MTTHDWRKRTSEGEKQRLIGRAWGSVVGTYLWYEIGERDQIVRERPNIIANCFTDHVVVPGDIECHRSKYLAGNPWLLRLRGGNLILHPSLIWGGARRYCPLYQIGHVVESKCVDDCLNFWQRMDVNARAGGHSHSDDI